MKKKLNYIKYKKPTVSNLLNKKYGKIMLHNEGERGIVLHESRSQFLNQVFKTSDRSNKTNIRIFSQRVTKAVNDKLSNIRISDQYILYHEDAKILLNILKKEILHIAKQHSKQNYGIIIPREIETDFFGGEPSLEYKGEGRIGGIKVNGRIDNLIEINSNHFIAQDFKSYEYELNIDPLDSESKDHRNFMQLCLYAIIFEEARNQKCKSIQLVYFPNKVIKYEFTEELRKKAIEFAKDTAFEGYEDVSLDFDVDTEVLPISEEEYTINGSESLIKKGENLIPKDIIEDLNDENDCLGWINTIPGKPLQLIKGKENKLKGYLYPSKASLVKDGHCVIVEKEDGVRIMCIVEKIDCLEESASTITKTHKEEHYNIKLNPVGEFNPKGYQELRPQTIIGGKIKIPTQIEFFQFKNLPLNGTVIGNIAEKGEQYPYHLDQRLLYQSMFIGGVQGTGKTSALKFLTLKINQKDNSPKVIILDNEGEYRNIIDIPTTDISRGLMEKLNLKSLDTDQVGIITLDSEDRTCLSLNAIDPLDFPFLLRELTPITHDSLSTILYDIVEENKGMEFTFPVLRSKIIEYANHENYTLASVTKMAICRALNSIALKIFDIPEYESIDIISHFLTKKVIIIDTHNLRDIHQRIVGLYLLALLHKIALKSEQNLKLLLVLDEIQRLLPKSKSNADSEYQKRIMGFLDEIVHRGRKRNYGVIFATHSPLDISKEIIDLCNIKVFFQIQGQTNYLLKEYLDKEERRQLKDFSTGEAFIMSKGKHQPVIIRFPYLN